MICNIHVIYDTFVLHLLVMRDGCFIREIKNIIGVRGCESECQEFVIANSLFIPVRLIIPVTVSSGFLIFYDVLSRLL